MRHWLQTRIDAEDHRLKRLRDRIIQAMMAFKRGVQGWRRPRSTRAVEAGFEYRAMLDRLKADDLPRFEARFKELLNENTIREVANFQSQLARERETIRERIGRINESMGQIDFNPGPLHPARGPSRRRMPTSGTSSPSSGPAPRARSPVRRTPSTPRPSSCR